METHLKFMIILPSVCTDAVARSHVISILVLHVQTGRFGLEIFR